MTQAVDQEFRIRCVPQPLPCTALLNRWSYVQFPKTDLETMILVKRVYSGRGYMKKAKQGKVTSKVSERSLLAQSHWESSETV